MHIQINSSTTTLGAITICCLILLIKIESLKHLPGLQSNKSIKIPRKDNEIKELKDLWEKRVENRNMYLTENKVREWGNDNTLGRVWEIFYPDWHCPRSERIGTRPEGGCWVCNYQSLQNSQNCVVYSLGAVINDRFERNIYEANPKCKIHRYDPTPRSVVEFHLDEKLAAFGAKFHNYEVTGDGKPKNIDGKDIPTVTLYEAMKRNGYNELTILKVDNEFSEWELFDKLLCDLTDPNCKPLPIDQVSIELHFRDAAEVVSLFEKMALHGYGIYSFEPNPIGYPSAAEFAFVRVKNSIL